DRAAIGSQPMLYLYLHHVLETQQAFLSTVKWSYHYHLVRLPGPHDRHRASDQLPHPFDHRRGPYWSRSNHYENLGMGFELYLAVASRSCLVRRKYYRTTDRGRAIWVHDSRLLPGK